MITMSDIIREGNPTLRKEAENLQFPLSDDIKKTAHDMMEFLINSQDDKIAEQYGLRAGVGLAAPQLDLSIRLIAVLIPSSVEAEDMIEDDSTTKNDNHDEKQDYDLKLIMVNPRVISHSAKKAALANGEGCLSVDREVPGLVPRAKKVTIRYYDLDGNVHKLKLRDYEAIVVQHEIDHTNGIMFYDHINEEDPFTPDDMTELIG
ncbi:MAG: peptide deformylase [Bavariicoccus seileri]|uniref:peptide deformylase n=1 Tax=Bavariicoccus seileri TaxID=549685 RepID=UPI003F9CE3E9